jgi:hypothetical protein
MNGAQVNPWLQPAPMLLTILTTNDLKLASLVAKAKHVEHSHIEGFIHVGKVPGRCLLHARTHGQRQLHLVHWDRRQLRKTTLEPGQNDPVHCYLRQLLSHRNQWRSRKTTAGSGQNDPCRHLFTSVRRSPPRYGTNPLSRAPSPTLLSIGISQEYRWP